MKTIEKNGQYQRLNDSDADMKVKTGWKFCPKSEWKTNVRDTGKPTKEEVEAATAEKAEKKSKREKS
jgi:glutathione synthase/RimK-type ligase-like ATP-grasp enzyme